jgi:acyl carrier protein
MENPRSNARFTKDAILADILEILEDMTSDWDMGFAGKISPETRLAADLAFESIQVVQLGIAIEERFHAQELPFQELFMLDDRNGRDLRVADLVDFLYTQFNAS